MDQKKVEEQLKRIQKLYDELGKKNPYEGMDPSKISSSVKETEKLTEALDGVQSRVDNLGQSFSDLQKQLQATIREIGKAPTPIMQMQSGFKGILTQVKKLTYEEEGIDKLNIKQLKSIHKIAKARISDASRAATQLLTESGLQGMINTKIDKRTKDYKNLSDAQKAAVGFLKEEDETVRSINDKINKRIKFEEKVIENLGITGGLIKGASGFMDKLGLGALASSINFNKLAESTDEFARNLEETNPEMGKTAKKQLVMAKGFEGMAIAIKEGLTDPLVQSALGLKGITFVFNKLKKGFLDADENVSSLAKNLNMSASEAQILNKQFMTASKGSGQLFVSSKGLTETLSEINSELGTSVILNQNQLETMTKLKKTAGLTGEEMMGIQKLSLANGQSFDENADSLLKQVSSLNKSSGIQINSKQVLKDISNLSEATTLSLGKNPVALAEAVTISRSLGMELSKVEAIAGSLLDFESSIENELQAELLLNKDLSLEKARQAALNNDLATVATEIAKQAGTAAEFSEMNRIQQEALAKAVGMGREDLAKTLFIQEQLSGASDADKVNRERILKNLTDQYGIEKAQKILKEDGLKGLLSQATETDKINASMDQMNESFMILGAALLPIVSMFASIASFISESTAATVIFGAALGALGAIATVLAVKSVVTSIASIFGSFAKIPFGLGIPAAVASVGALGGIIGGVGAMVASAGDVNSPADGKTQISTKEGGLFELSKNDDIVAFPGASKMMNGGYGGGTTVVQQDNSETNNLLKQLISTNQQGNGLLSKQPQLSAVGLYEVQ